MEPVRIGVIGGSGLYNIPGLSDVESHEIVTSFGTPSDTIRVGTLEGQRVAFIARHGRGHILTPSEVPYRANVFALKTMGVEHLIAISACGSLREEIEPGHIVVPDQLIDLTKAERGRSFFGQGLVAHVSVSDPFCADLNSIVADEVAAVGGTAHRGGTYVTAEGPRFSTRAESALFRTWGASIIGMTTSPEAYLAREAEMCYSVMAHVTDYDVWYDEDVSVELVLQRIKANTDLAQRALVGVVRRLGAGVEDCACHHALQSALITNPQAVPQRTLERLWPLVGKYFDLGE